jgi:excisionase family DNA binding protein
MTDATRRDTDATEVVEWLPVPDAAKRLGISERTVQRRVREGKLKAQEEGRRLLVGVNVSRQSPENVHSDATMTPNDATLQEGTERFIKQLEAENAFLKSELEKRNTAESELRRLMLADKNELQELRQKVALLLPSAPNAAQSHDVNRRSEEQPEGGKDSLTPKRGFWQRLFRKE